MNNPYDLNTLDVWAERVTEKIKSRRKSGPPETDMEILHILQDEVALEMEAEGYNMEGYKQYIGFVRFSRTEDPKYL